VRWSGIELYQSDVGGVGGVVSGLKGFFVNPDFTVTRLYEWWFLV